MKILHIITSLRVGGAEKLLLDIVPLLQKKNHKISVLLFDGIETPFKIQLEEIGIKIYTFGTNTMIYNPFLIFRLFPFLLKFDVIHAHNTACIYWLACAKFLSRNRIAIVATEHSTFNRRRNSSLFKFIDKFIYKQYDEMICVSDKTKETLSSFIGREKHITTIANGVNLNVYYDAEPVPRETLGVKVDDVIIMKVAGFREEKDQDTVINALTLLPANYHLILVGDGIRRTICEQLAKELSVIDRVHFLGIRSDVAQLLKTADVVLMSSYYEGLSLSSLEGMSVGKPFVASDVNGLHELVNGFGLLFELGNFNQLSEILLDLINNPQYSKEIANKCLDRARSFDIAKTVDGYNDLYNSIVR